LEVLRILNGNALEHLVLKESLEFVKSFGIKRSWVIFCSHSEFWLRKEVDVKKFQAFFSYQNYLYPKNLLLKKLNQKLWLSAYIIIFSFFSNTKTIYTQVFGVKRFSQPWAFF
jgi:hypothetical protein